MQVSGKMTLQQAQQQITNDGIEIVRFEISDFYGISYSRSVAARHFQEKVENGLTFCLAHLGMDPQAGMVPETGFSEEIGYCDGLGFADLNTFRPVPWLKDTARILMSPTLKGFEIQGYPRTIASRLLRELNEMGFSLFSSHEHEFFVFDEKSKRPITEEVRAHSTTRFSKNNDFLLQIAKQMPKVGVNIEVLETEYAPGQFEISYKPEFGLQAADNAFTFKNGIKEIAQGRGYLASFITKPFLEYDGASAHFNHSLWDKTCTNSLMYDASSSHGLSIVAQHWIAGILHHAPAITVLMSPTVNCLTRIVKNRFAPVNVTWGIDNRSVAARVKINGEKGTYVENRIGSAAGCPYTSLAATVAAGIDGIRNQYTLPNPVVGDAYDDAILPPDTILLPSDMESALKQLQDDKVICDAFGKEFLRCFVALKRHEARLEAEATRNGLEHSEWARSFYSGPL